MCIHTRKGMGWGFSVWWNPFLGMVWSQARDVQEWTPHCCLQWAWGNILRAGSLTEGQTLSHNSWEAPTSEQWTFWRLHTEVLMRKIFPRKLATSTDLLFPMGRNVIVLKTFSVLFIFFSFYFILKGGGRQT